MKLMPTKDRFEIKKDKGVCRWESEIMARVMDRFSNTVTKKMNRNSPKRTGYNLRSSDIPRIRNS
jgi:hypothetical protein